GAAYGHLVVDVELTKLAEGFVIGLDGGVRRLESKRHGFGGERLSVQRSGRNQLALCAGIAPANREGRPFHSGAYIHGGKCIHGGGGIHGGVGGGARRADSSPKLPESISPKAEPKGAPMVRRGRLPPRVLCPGGILSKAEVLCIRD